MYENIDLLRVFKCACFFISLTFHDSVRTYLYIKQHIEVHFIFELLGFILSIEKTTQLDIYNVSWVDNLTVLHHVCN
jgi:hypothetical protein